MRIFLFITFFILQFSIFSEELKYYYEYKEMLKNSNFDLKIQEEKISEILLSLEQKKAFFRTPLSIDYQIMQGKIQQPYNLITNDFASSSSLHRYSIGISKVIDFLNQQKSEREIIDLKLQIEKLHKEILEKQILISFRNIYFSLIFLNKIRNHLKEHIVRFQNLKNKYGYNYFDKKLGIYTYAALNMGITTLGTEYVDTEKEIHTEIMKIKNLLNQKMEFSFHIDSFSSIAYLLPDLEIPMDETAIYNSSFYKIEKINLEIQKKKIIQAKKNNYSTELFLNYGESRLGKFNNPSLSLITPEKESFINFGIRASLPYFSENSYNPEVEENRLRIQTLQMEKFENNLKNLLILEINNYKNLLKQYKKNLEILQNSEPYIELLEESFINNRISYFELWSEHERYHNLLKSTAYFYIQAWESLGNIEIITNQVIGEKR